MNEGRKGCRAAASEREEVEEAVVEGEVDAGREDNDKDGEDNVGGTESEIIPESKVVEIGSGCAVSTEDGTGIEDVSSGFGFWNEPLIRSSLCV